MNWFSSLEEDKTKTSLASVNPNVSKAQQVLFFWPQADKQ
jgi:hypothetical protein